jgi:hypothetical protein
MNQSGITKRIAPIATYTFGNLAASTTGQVIVGQHIDATTFTEADLLVRFHTGTTIATGTFTVGLVADGWTFNDPASAFLASLSRTIQVSSTSTFPFYGIVPVPPAWGRSLAVTLLATQGATMGNLTAVMSADFALKGGDADGLPVGPNGNRGYRGI